MNTHTEVLPQVGAFILVIVAISLLSVSMYRTVSLGRQSAREGRQHLAAHRRSVDLTIGATLLLIASIKLLGYATPVHVHQTDSWLFMVHMFFSLPFLLSLLALRFWLDGVRYQPRHCYLAYAAASLFLGVLVTGAAMLAFMMIESQGTL